MKALKLASLILCVLLLTNCAPKLISKGDAYPDHYKEVPHSILVLPPINESTAADAKDAVTKKHGQNDSNSSCDASGVASGLFGKIVTEVSGPSTGGGGAT